jgi:hypothetical protein
MRLALVGVTGGIHGLGFVVGYVFFGHNFFAGSVFLSG